MYIDFITGMETKEKEMEIKEISIFGTFINKVYKCLISVPYSFKRTYICENRVQILNNL